MFEARRSELPNANRDGLCLCGCGRPTPLATENRADRGYYKGQPLRYIRGHHIGKGEHSHRWRGGRWVHPSGYVWIYSPDHPFKNAKGYVYEHRMVMEKRLGRFLDPGERVHHLNHKRGDNRDENLVLFPSHSDHVRAEHKNALRDWLRRNPERAATALRTAGRKGADARWKKR